MYVLRERDLGGALFERAPRHSLPAESLRSAVLVPEGSRSILATTGAQLRGALAARGLLQKLHARVEVRKVREKKASG